MREFTWTGQPGRVVFGAGSLERLPEEIERLGARRALVLSTPGQRAGAEALARRLGERSVGVHAGAVMHVPADSARAGVEEAKRVAADCLVSWGGGSTIGLAKAIALDSGLPIVAIPTTYAGSEMTPIYGLTEGGLKRTGRDPRVLPKVVLYDPALTLALPVGVSAASGLNAMAHAVEALYAADGNPVTSLMAEEGLRALARGLPVVVERPDDLEARAECLYGAWLCGLVLGTCSLGLHHKLCHVLGGFGLPHADTHAVILPHAAAYNAPAAPVAMARVAAALGTSSAPSGLHALARRIGAPTALRDLGLSEDALDRATRIAAAASYPNPRPLEPEALRALLQRAWEGLPPVE